MGTTEIGSAFGEAVRRHRLDASLSQEGLADSPSFDRTYVSLLERGLRQPSLETVFRLAKVLRLPATKLILDTEAILTLPATVEQTASGRTRAGARAHRRAYPLICV
jgi:transcriptional regulator with XRE-family HTH domain